jgi:5-methylcytosine-specific restriction endonuclease McrA
MATVIISRSEARAQGLKRYFTGKPCHKGHVAERYVSNLECVVCKTDKDNARQWHKANPERHRENRRRWDRANSEKKQRYREENRDKLNAYFKERWHSLPAEERKAKKRAWYEANREHAVRYTAQWVCDNPEQAKATKAVVAHRRRERKVASGGSFTQDDLRALLKAQSYRCAYCRADLRKAKRHLDHIQPLALGGANDRTNLQWLCAPCNLSKGARDPIVFAQQMGRLI